MIYGSENHASRMAKLRTIGFVLAYVALVVLCAMFVAVTGKP